MLSKYQKIMISLASFAAALIIFGNNPSAVALNPNIVFETNPLFNEVDFLPGQSVSRYMRVKNINDFPRIAGIRADNFIDPDIIGSQLAIIVRQEDKVLYSGTLVDFSNAGEIELSSIDPGETVQYDFSVTFYPLADNQYALKTLTFNILAGFIDE